jgi:hypothetical protein
MQELIYEPQGCAGTQGVDQEQLESGQVYMEAVQQSGAPTPQFIAIKNDILMTIRLVQFAGRRVLKKPCGRTLPWTDIHEVMKDATWSRNQTSSLKRAKLDICTFSAFCWQEWAVNMPWPRFHLVLVHPR